MGRLLQKVKAVPLCKHTQPDSSCSALLERLPRIHSLAHPQGLRQQAAIQSHRMLGKVSLCIVGVWAGAVQMTGGGLRRKLHFFLLNLFLLSNLLKHSADFSRKETS
ncbi:hypothetical protein XENTR_v10007878 [Xenopus tropicalis]|nr:hypothetical protein XENTR_v10007878 [Xenopus tropicalis]